MTSGECMLFLREMEVDVTRLRYRWMLFTCASGYFDLARVCSSFYARHFSHTQFTSLFSTFFSCCFSSWGFSIEEPRHFVYILMHINVVLIRSVLWILIWIVNGQMNAVNIVKSIVFYWITVQCENQINWNWHTHTFWPKDKRRIVIKVLRCKVEWNVEWIGILLATEAAEINCYQIFTIPELLRKPWIRQQNADQYVRGMCENIQVLHDSMIYASQIAKNWILNQMPATHTER